MNGRGFVAVAEEGGGVETVYAESFLPLISAFKIFPSLHQGYIRISYTRSKAYLISALCPLATNFTGTSRCLH